VCLLEPLWDQFAALLPVWGEFVASHPLMDDALAARDQRLRHHLQWPLAGR
jgi:hypothetical protein